jgi:hypothetical protein
MESYFTLQSHLHQYTVTKFIGPTNWAESKHAVITYAYILDAESLLQSNTPPTMELLPANKMLYMFILAIFSSSPAFIYIENVKHGDVYGCWQALLSTYENTSKGALMDRFLSIISRKQ